MSVQVFNMATIPEEQIKTESEAVVPSPNSDLLKERHQLKRTWTLWYLNDKKNLDWLQRLHEVCSVDTIEDFWMLMKNVRPPSRLNNTCDYNVFRDHIRPVWEVPDNKSGGRWLINIDRSKHPEVIDIIWMEILIAMIGEQFGEDSEQICGIVCNIRNKGSKISIWTRDCNDEEANKRIGQVIKEKLMNADIPEYINGPLFDTMRYEDHDDVQQKSSSQIKSKLIISSTVNN
uniref:eIF-4F 25 kDa subunit n=1 Tax=Steinernema glaseri TaxID=37863 RepID=A0A1I8A4K9_9BILA